MFANQLIASSNLEGFNEGNLQALWSVGSLAKASGKALSSKGLG
jgi:hypothetical protein